MKLTIKEIAERANVSITTVSRVLNNKREGVGEETRKKVEEIIRKYNYRPNAIARSMITKNTKTIGLIVPDIRNPFFSDLARGIEDVANEKGYSVILCNVDNNIEKLVNYIWLLSEKNVDGLIFSSSNTEISEEVQEQLENTGIPLVVIDRGINTDRYSGVFIDNVKAGYIATKHLIELSHTKIGCITGPKSVINSEHRLEGYKMALLDANLKIDPRLIISGDYTMEGGYHATCKLLEQEDISAVFAFNDLMAFGVYQATDEHGIRIPDDLSVVGFDNLNYNGILTPKLTTIEQPIYKIGEMAVSQILKQIDEQIHLNDSFYLDTKLIIRESTTKLSKNN